MSAAFVWWFNLISPTLRPPITGRRRERERKNRELGQR